MTLEETQDEQIKSILLKRFTNSKSGCLKCSYHGIFKSRWIQLAEQVIEEKFTNFKITWTKKETGSYKIERK